MSAIRLNYSNTFYMQCIKDVEINGKLMFESGVTYLSRLLDPADVVKLRSADLGCDIEIKTNTDYWHSVNYQLSGSNFEKININKK